jgi:hypothetical protein
MGNTRIFEAGGRGILTSIPLKHVAYFLPCIATVVLCSVKGMVNCRNQKSVLVSQGADLAMIHPLKDTIVDRSQVLGLSQRATRESALWGSCCKTSHIPRHLVPFERI